MKKIVLLVLVGIMCLTLAGCNKKEPVGANKESNTTVVDKNTEKDNTTEENEAEREPLNDILAGTYNVPLEKIYVNIPNEFQGATYRNVESGKTQIWNIGFELNIGFSADYSEKVTSMDEAIEKSLITYKRGVSSYLDIREVAVEKEENFEVNGIPVYRFEGELVGDRSSGEVRLYTVGYVFSMDGIPCRIQGMVLCQNENCEVFDQETHELMEEEVRETVDAMIKTLRAEP